MKTINGWHVFAMFGLGFGIIIAVNLTLAINAVRTFPGVEAKNSYVASQKFDANRAAQQALDWDVAATLSGNQLSLEIAQDGTFIAPSIESATFGRATSVAADQTPDFVFDGQRGALDHAIASDDLAGMITGAAEWHINADEPDLLNYNSTFNNADFFEPSAFASSDHDPLIVGINTSPNDLFLG